MKRIYLIAVMLLSSTILFGCGKKEETYGLSKSQPTIVTVWNYYNGAQKETFDKIVQEFNNTVGMEKGIVVDSVSKGTINELNQAIADSLSGQVGASNLPDAVAAYADVAYEIDVAGKALDLKKYLSEEEISQYVDAYMEEGDFGDGLKLFPIAKSTELLLLNKTDWDTFASECSVGEEALSTWEDIAGISEQYYHWTDSQTPEPEDGKALFGRDAFANYLIIGSRQLGHEIYRVEDGKTVLDFDKETMRKLWDYYYVPYINGYFGSYGKFRSDDVKTGKLLAVISSSSGVTYFPQDVTLEDGTSYEIETKSLPLPNFRDTEPWAVQQGAGMLVTKSEPKREFATIEFLKWFTDTENNMEFTMNSGYLPVKKAANSKAAFEKMLEQGQLNISDGVKSSVLTSLEIVEGYHLYTTKAFEGGNDARSILNDSMDQRAQADRKAVVELMDSGMSREEAVATFDTDANFLAWYEETFKQLQQIGGA